MLQAQGKDQLKFKEQEIMSSPITLVKPDFWLTVKRTTMGRCPRCGVGHLFNGYLKPVASCAACGEPLGHIRAEDGPAWLTILLVGHILAPFILAFGSNNWPDWAGMIVWAAAALVLSLLLLPRAKGFFIGVIWRSGCIGAEQKNEI